MKKIYLCLITICLFLLLFSFSIFATGSNTKASAKTITVGKNITISVSDDEEDVDYYLLFKAPETTTYSFSSSIDLEDYYGSVEILDSNGKELTSHDDFLDSYEEISYKMTSGKTYYIHFHWDSYYEKQTVTFSAKKHSHTYKVDDYEKAKYDYYGDSYYDGYVEKYCVKCGFETKTTYPCVETIILSATSYTYDGKTKKPTIIVKDRKGKELKKDTDYTVSGTTSAKAAGSYSVTVKLKGNYSGSEKLTYKIKPTKPTGFKVSKTTSNSITLTWNKVEGATSYTVYKDYTEEYWSEYSKVSKVTTNSLKVSKLYNSCGYKFKLIASKDGVNSDAVVITAVTSPSKPEFTTVRNCDKGKACLNLYSYDDICGYQIYMSTSKDGKFTLAKDIETYTGEISLIVSKLAKGKTYYFKVRTYYSEENMIAYSSFTDVRSCKISY